MWHWFSVAGAIGGLLAWLGGELLFGKWLTQELTMGQRFALDAAYGLVTGCLLGLTLGIGQWKALRRWWLPPVATVLGAIGGFIGLLWGEALYQLLRFAELPARSIGWAIVGFALGSSQGVARGSLVGAMRAGLGGGIGGGVGGLLFALLPSLTRFPDPACRGLAWVLMGALIGSASALFERLLASATLKVASGKLEGKEFILDKPRLIIGRDERCDIPIYYDRAVQPRHAVLEWTGTNYRIAPIGNAPVIVNGQTVSVKELNHNDVLLIGNTRLVYRLRAARTATLFCANCYAPNREGAKFCRSCGKPFVPLELPKEPISRWLAQVAVAASVLMCCLVTSYGLGTWMGRTKPVVTVASPPPQFAPIAKGWQTKPLRLAATPPHYDDIGSVLWQMGFRAETIGIHDLTDFQRLQQFDAVFVNCSDGCRNFSDGRALTQYVAEGGILYASDYACDVVAAAFPQALQFGISGLFAFFGEELEATVVDQTLADFIGPRIRLRFDLPAWQHVERWHPSCRVYLMARSGWRQRALLVSFTYGKGFVVFTSFHNKAQTSEVERRLIEFLAVRPLTMRLSQQIAQEIARPVEVGAVGAQKGSGLLTGRQMVMEREIIGKIGANEKSPVYQFTLTQNSPVKIVVGWEGGEGDFTVTLWHQQQPQQRWEQRATAPPLVLTVPEPLPAGVYCVQLIAHKTPLPQTPFVIGIGLAKGQ